MLWRWLAPLGFAILLLGWDRNPEILQVAVTLLFALFAGWVLNVLALEDPPDSGKAEGEVVSLAGYRRQRGRRETGERRSELQNIYESQCLNEAECITSMLEYEGIPTHVLNRHNGSILIHPMAEMRFKVLVPLDAEAARMLIEEDLGFASPEDSSIA